MLWISSSSPLRGPSSARTQAIRLGNALDFEHDMGSLMNPGQLERVSMHVGDARGLRQLTGGRRREDLGELFYEPTILTGVTPEMECYAEETFGPVVSVYAVADEDEAVARANESDYGLNASVWTSTMIADAAWRARSVRLRERQRGLCRHFREHRCPHGRNEGLWARPTSGTGRHPRFVEVQSVATQTGIPIAPSHGLDGKSFTSVMTGVLRMMKKAGRA